MIKSPVPVITVTVIRSKYINILGSIDMKPKNSAPTDANLNAIVFKYDDVALPGRIPGINPQQ